MPEKAHPACLVAWHAWTGGNHAGLDDALKIPLCGPRPAPHSREGGNPFGTTVCHTAEIRPGMKSIAAGTFDETDWFAIDRHIWVQSKQSWVTIPEGVAAYPKAFNPSLREDVNLVSKT